MAGWIPSALFMLSIGLQMINGSSIRFANPKWRKENRWKLSATGNGGPAYAIMGAVSEFVMYGLAWISILPTPKAHDAFGYPLFRPADWLVWVAVALVVLAGMLNSLSRRALGRFWFPGVAYRKGHQIVASGPYSYVRHPMYTSYFMYALGCLIASGCNLVVLACALWVTTAYVMRIKHEEKMLIRVRAQQYNMYLNSTGKLLPKFSTLRTKWLARFGGDPHTS